MHFYRDVFFGLIRTGPRVILAFQGTASITLSLQVMTPPITSQLPVSNAPTANTALAPTGSVEDFLRPVHFVWNSLTVWLGGVEYLL